MAEADGQTVTPDRRFARNFASKHRLKPPVDVAALLERRANVEHVDLPGSWEAIVLRRAGQKPTVLVDNRVHASRLRFTLAHELGHILLPWQFGIALCDLESVTSVASAVIGDAEAEANRFASEILLPRAWLGTQVPQPGDDPTEVIREISRMAEVSPITTSIALAALYTVPTATCIVGQDGAKYAVRSEGCPMLKSAEWWRDPTSLTTAGGQVYSQNIGQGRTLLAVTFCAPLKESARPPRSKADLLEEMVRVWNATDRAAVGHQMNGIIGAANNAAGACKTVGEIERLLRGRLVARDGLIGRLMRHRRFDEYVVAAAHDLFAKKRQRRR